MSKIEVFDPAMCCTTGVCGPETDPRLAGFAADVEWFKRRGVEVARFGLAQEPGAFTANPVVRNAIESKGLDCLPIVLADGRVVATGEYPSREALASAIGMKSESVLTPAVAELVAIAASIASNCKPCLNHHVAQARRFGLSDADIRDAIGLAQNVKEAPAAAVLDLAEKLLAEGGDFGAVKSCCGPQAKGMKCC